MTRSNEFAAIVLGPFSGGLSITTDSLQITAPVTVAGVMPLYPKTYSAIRLGSAAANTFTRGHLAWIHGDLRAQRGHGRYVPRPLGGTYYEAVRKRGD